MPPPVVVLDRMEDGPFDYSWLNEATRSYAGFDLSLIEGKTPSEAFPGRLGRRLEAQQQATVRSARPRTYVYSLRLPRGEVRIETLLTPLKDDSGEVVPLVATMTDRTEDQDRALANASIETARLERDSEVERFISMAAHDLRTPMRHVQAIAEMLRSNFVDHGDGKMELIEMLETLGHTSSGLITDVHAYARASSAPVATRNFELGALGADDFTVLDPKGEHTLESGTGSFAADDVALQIVLHNLVDNALKHGGEAPRLLSLRFEGEEDGTLEFSVRENGRGFADPSVAFLDNGDFRVGAGFGLLGIRRLLLALGGDIWAEVPEDGTGTLIRYTVPEQVIGAEIEDPPLRATA